MRTVLGTLTALAALAALPAAAQVADWRRPDPANLLMIETSKGTILVELAPDIAPRHVARIKSLARQGYYDRTAFYRTIKGFMAQAGDNKGTKKLTLSLPKLKREFEFKKTAATPFVSFGPAEGGETGFIGTMPVTVGSDGATAYALFCPGVASMAHTAGDPDSATSQIFLMRGRAPTLDRTFTPWGRVIQGQEVVDAIKDGEPPPSPDTILRARIVSDLPAAQRPDIEVMDVRGPAFAAVYAEEVKKYGPNFNPCFVPIAARTDGEATAAAPAAPASP